MTAVERNIMVRRCTDSVLSYMASESGMGTVREYFSRNLMGLPNYSEMLGVMKIGSGTTKEGVRFDSIYVDRSLITKNLRELYAQASS